MFAAGFALVVIGLILGFLIPPFGFLVAIVGIVLFVMALLSARRGGSSAA